MESDISLFLCSDQTLVKGKQCLVNFIHIIVSPFNKIFYNDVEFTRMRQCESCLAQMQEMLGKAGFTLSRSSKFEIIVEYFVERGNYNVYEINEALFAFDQSLIGA